MPAHTKNADEVESKTGSQALHDATERAEKAEARLAEVEQGRAKAADTAGETRTIEYDDQASGSPAKGGASESESESEPESGSTGGVAELRKDSMMAHLLDSLDAGKDIGHYGRLVFAMVARHFLSDGEVLAWLNKDRDFSAEQATLMLRQVEGRDYNPPKRERILEWQREQEFQILPDAADPDCGNLYRTLKFPESVYKHIGHYQEQKVEAEG